MAEIIRFPAPWRRAWLVCLVSDGVYRGEMHGDQVAPGEGPTITGPWSHRQVMQLLSLTALRRGLPVIPCWNAPDDDGD